MNHRSFRRMRLVDVPKTSPVPHSYDQTEARDVRVSSSTLGDVRVHVRVTGSGPPLLLVHGLMTSSFSFRYILEPLGKHFRVHAVDMPGSGGSDKPLDPHYSPRNLGVFLSELQRELGIRGSAVMGNSMGGYIAMHMALHDPAAVSRLVVNHAPGIPEPRFWALRAALSSSILRSGLRRFVQRDPHRWVFRNVRYRDESMKSREEIDRYASILGTDEGVSCFLKSLRETMNPSGFEEFVRELNRAPFPVPMLLVYAGADSLVPPRIGQQIHRLARGSKFEVLEGLSHFSHIDAPQKVVDTILPFLSQADSSTVPA